MKIYGCQLDIAWEDKPANFQKVLHLLKEARPEPGSLIFLPEMFATGFSMNVAAVADDGATMKFLGECATSLGLYIAGGFVTRAENGKGRNELLVVAPEGKFISQYAKIHPFTFGQESIHYVGGDKICTFPWAGTTVSPFICYDLRFPEIFRRAMRGGAEVLAVIANWPVAREEHWITLLRARAIENQTYVIGVNRCGRDPQFTYSGRSLIVDPHGKVIADAGSKECIFGTEIDIPALREYRKAFPILGDVRPQYLGQQ